jgi:hypothetical protein
MFKKLICAAVLVALSGCGGGSGSSPSSYQSSGITGVVQKGPLIYGSYVNAYLLDENLNPTGQSYVTRTTDDLGNFKISSNISSSLVALIATGYYFDEVSGSLSTAPTTLSAIVDLNVNATPTINVLTTLQEPRVKVLLSEGKTYSQALQQSAREVLSVIGIDTTKIDQYQSLYGMQINGNKDADSVLLAASTVLAQVSSTAALRSGSSPAAELSYYLSRIASDIANYGTLKEASIITSLKEAQTAVNLSRVRSNVETYYAGRGTSLVAPKFEEWIDKDGSGHLPRRLLSLAGISLTDQTDVEPLQDTSSNQISIADAGSGTYVYVESSAINSIVKNNDVIAGKYTTVKDGDAISFKQTSGKIGKNTSITAKIGSTSLTWNVSTRTPNLKYKSADGGFPYPGSGIPGDDLHYFHAFPVQVSDSFTAKYFGTSFNGYGAGTKLLEFSIYSDNNGSPGTKLLSPDLNFTSGSGFPDYFGSTTLSTTDSAVQIATGSLGFGTKLGDGLSLSSGDKIWIVFKFDTAYDPGSRGNSSVPFSARKVSDDGSSWSNYAGQSNGRYSDSMPMIFLTD